MTRRGPFAVWLPVAALFAAWLGHVSLSYAAAGLRCHEVLLEGDVLSIQAWKFAMFALTLGAAVLLALMLPMFMRRRDEGDESEREGDVELSGFMGIVLSTLFGAYLIWSIVQAVSGTAVC